MIGASAMIVAKYIHETKTTNGATAREFYFTSDLLDGKEHEITATDEGTASVTFQLGNHEDSLRYSEVDIDYTVNVVQNDSDTEIEDENIANKTGKINKGSVQNAEVTIKNLEPGKTYTVTATTSNTYKKTLTGTIKVKNIDQKVYTSVRDKNSYIEVTVWTVDYSGTVKLTYGDIKLIPDNTDSMMETAKRGGDTLNFTGWKANTSHVFRFFKEDTTKKSYKAAVNGTEVTVSEE